MVAVRGWPKPKLAMARSRPISSVSALWTTPPSPTANDLVACMENTTLPGKPAPKPRPSAETVPSDAAASTTTGTPSLCQSRS